MIEHVHARLVNAAHKPIFQYFLLAAITLFAIVLRFYKLGEWGFWIDEIYTTNRAQTALANLQNWPPLTETLLGITFAWLDVNEWSSRLMPALIGIISIPILFFPIKSLFGRTTALLTGLLLAISPWHLYWSQNARFYTLLLLLYTLALLFFFMGLERDRPWYIWVSALLLTFAAREHMTALFFIPVALTYFLAVTRLSNEKPGGFRLKNLLPLGLPLAAIGLYELFNYMFGIRVNSVEQFADITTGGPRSSGIQVVLSLFVGNPGPSPFWVLTSILQNVGLPLICLGFFTGVHLTIKKNRGGLLLLLGGLVPLVTILILSTFVYSLDRYIFVSLSSWLILGAMGIKEVFQRFEKSGVVLALGIAILFLITPLSQDMLYYKYQHGNRSDWKGAYAFISQNKHDGDLFYASQPELGEYYMGEDVMFMRAANPDMIEQSRRRVWFIDNGWINPNTQTWIRENSDLVGVYDVYTPLETLTMRVYFYGPE